MSVSRYRILKNYMEEDGFLCGPSYVVWLHGCTDGWPQAIFTSKKAAEEWVKTIPLNPEGFRIEEINFRKLCEEITEAKAREPVGWVRCDLPAAVKQHRGVSDYISDEQVHDDDVALYAAPVDTAALAERVKTLEEALRSTLAALVATTSLLVRADQERVRPSRAVASDAMFRQMLKDYDKAAIVARTALGGSNE